ncbi:MAG TPA: hypothetical protein PLJ04_00190 [Candidatus Saccharibacteria bacterium]|nr:hypothetical protein [Candidatus Saccharibacteria bacterium]HPD98919.1 hypothetical protein [Candidatus Saccharibacteria bacterium]HPR09981.1 hypothetical protein [Candidatus Saccharibacteria bacterium]
MKNITAKFTDSLQQIVHFIVRYRVTLFIVISASILGVVLLGITAMSDAEPSESQIADAEKSVKIIKFNEASVKVFDSLKANNVTIETLFDPNRYDPFN